MNCWRLRVKTPWGPRPKEVPTLWEFTLQELAQVFTDIRGEKSPHASSEGERIKILQSTLLCFTRSALKRQQLTTACPAEILSEHNWPEGKKIPNSLCVGKVKHPILAHSSHPVSHKGGENYQTPKTLSRDGFTERLRPNHRTIESFPATHLTTLLGAYLQPFLLPGTTCPAIKKKLQDILKGENNLKRQNKYQNQIIRIET